METAEYDHMARVEERHWWFRARLAVVKTFLKKYVPKGRGLDCSCGTGMTLASLPDWVQVGADLHNRALKHAQGRGLNRLIQTDLRRLPFDNDSLDVVTSLDTLEHIQEDADALGEIYRVLKPGGHTLITVPANPWMFSSHDRALHHVRRYTSGELRTKVITAGFDLRKFRKMNTALFPLVALVRAFSKGENEASGDTDSVPSAPVNAALYAAFAAEKFLLPYVPAPWGVSLLCLARKPLA